MECPIARSGTSCSRQSCRGYRVVQAPVRRIDEFESAANTTLPTGARQYCLRPRLDGLFDPFVSPFATRELREDRNFCGLKGDNRIFTDRPIRKVGRNFASIREHVFAVFVEAIFDESPIAWRLPRCCYCNLPKRDVCAPIRLVPGLEPKSRHRFQPSEPLSRLA